MEVQVFSPRLMILKDKILELRLKGYSYREISKELDCSKGTISYYCKDLSLTAEVQDRLAQHSKDNWNKFSQRAREHTLSTHEDRVMFGRMAWEMHHDTLCNNLKNSYKTGSLSYRKDELAVKAILEAKYATVFTKEEINGRFFDFCSSAYIIEHSIDPTKGLRDMTVRFGVLADCSRRKIAYINPHNVGPLRRSRLKAVTDEIHSIHELCPDQ